MQPIGVVTGTAILNSGVTLLARILGNSGIPITRASLSSISYTVRDLTTPETVATGQALTISSVVYDDLQQSDPRWDKDSEDEPGRDGRWGYNFAAVIPAAHFTSYTVGSYSPYPVTGHRYQVDVKFVPASGQPFVQPFQFTALPTYV